MSAVRLLAATGGLGFTPPDPSRSYLRALERRPDAIVADAGSADIGPFFLGADAVYNEPEWERLDLERLLDGAARLDVPLIVGSCAGTGTDRGVEAYAQMVDELARARGRSFRTALIFAQQEPSWLEQIVADGRPARALTPLLGELSPGAVAASDTVVAVMGAQPIRAALGEGAQVVLAGRACDDGLFAAAAQLHGADRAAGYLAGKLLENASLVAEPFVLRESVIGELVDGSVIVEPMLPEQRCTRASVAAQLMYERATPFKQAGPGGELDLSQIQIEELDDRRVALRGARYRDLPPALKVEGAGCVGQRSLCIVGCRDPRMIAALDPILDEVRTAVSSEGAKVSLKVYGRDAVMGDLEQAPGGVHEVGIVAETVAPTQTEAHRACVLAKRLLFSAKYPLQKQTGGSVLSTIDEVVECGPAYRWTVNHVVSVRDVVEPFRTEMRTLGAGA